MTGSRQATYDGSVEYGTTPASGSQNADDAMSGTVHQAQDKVKAAGHKVQETAEKGIDKAAEGVEGVATKLRDKATETGGVAAEAGTRVADGMEKTASYIREHDTAEIKSDAERFVRNHPMRALIGALVVGFLFARLTRKR